MKSPVGTTGSPPETSPFRSTNPVPRTDNFPVVPAGLFCDDYPPRTASWDKFSRPYGTRCFEMMVLTQLETRSPCHALIRAAPHLPPDGSADEDKSRSKKVCGLWAKPGA
jgi:hypothetical protein